MFNFVKLLSSLLLLGTNAEGFIDPSLRATTSSRTNLPMSAKDCIAVIGSTGKLGREVVEQLSSRGVPTKCLIRQDVPPSFLSSLPNVEFVKGDVTNKESLKSLLSDTTACLAVHGCTRRSRITDLLPFTNPELESNHAKQVNYEGIRNILEAAKASGTCKRIVRITGNGENPFQFFSILINLLGSFAKAWNYEGEEVLRNCTEVDYTIIRPGIMKQDKPASGKVLALRDNGQPLKVSAIPYTNIAQLCIECLDYPNTARTTLTAMTVPDPEGETSWGPLLSKVESDTRKFPASFLAEHKRAVLFGGSVLAGVFAVMLTALLMTAQWVLNQIPIGSA